MELSMMRALTQTVDQVGTDTANTHGGCVLKSAILMLCLIAGLATAQNVIKIPVGEVLLNGHFYPGTAATPDTKLPTILALHGCGGMLDRTSKANLRTQVYAKLLNDQGWNVLFLDSFAGRKIKQVCGTNNALLSPAQRVADVQAALSLLQEHPAVDAQRLAVLGWSHGGSVTLLSNAKGSISAKMPVVFVAFYPGCGSANVQSVWSPAKPTLMLLGERDDWANPKPCQSLAERHKPLLTQTTFPNAYHGFDSDLPLQTRPDVISRMTRQPVHMGGEPNAKRESQAMLIEFFKAHFNNVPTKSQEQPKE
jgi:dienelactone hydrolase